ncbi:Hsp20/alpha crystallin family protein [Bombilactobacillus thymidiniphilus]|uniref:Hsp20/alpha crystallin family protein n=1 Tax=Bombilactobacillus thymidiniphilus TaxID=2923363 RepID=A0ABY4PFA9_9LACO|nr:Hsp20/alpha crystallin family protein [Bombilactobacillus thymidiniphilus]UQS84204.1 Hsp20/alpha crystallin family protein [Bombilactobacillus thymidiniphilus]
MHNNLANRRDDLFDVLNNWFSNWNEQMPNESMKTDVSESNKAYTVAIDLPDLNKKDISLSYDHDILTVSATREYLSEASDNDDNLIMNERSYGRLNRQYSLPGVDQKAITARYQNGVLKVILPKSHELPDKETKIDIQ